MVQDDDNYHVQSLSLQAGGDGGVSKRGMFVQKRTQTSMLEIGIVDEEGNILDIERYHEFQRKKRIFKEQKILERLREDQNKFGHRRMM